MISGVEVGSLEGRIGVLFEGWVLKLVDCRVWVGWWGFEEWFGVVWWFGERMGVRVGFGF